MSEARSLETLSQAPGLQIRQRDHDTDDHCDQTGRSVRNSQAYGTLVRSSR